MITINLKLLKTIAEEWHKIKGTTIYPTYVINSDGSGDIVWECNCSWHNHPELMEHFNKFLKKKNLPLWWVEENHIVNLNGFSIVTYYKYRIELKADKR